MSGIRTEKLAVGYDGKALIHDICLDIQKGEIVVLIGPNGSGKSTILKSITKHLKLIGGKVLLGDENLDAVSYKELAKKMAVVLTERIHPELMTCYDVVAMGRFPYTGSLGRLTEEDRNKVEAAMKAVHAEEIAGQDFMEISDGQRQRVLLARALCQEPEIMILDEPTSFLDIKHKIELLQVLRSMARMEEITVVLSLHEIDLAQKFADKIICVKGEMIADYGAPEDVFSERKVMELYDMEEGSYDVVSGSVELPKVCGEPKVFVLSNGGYGTSVYRQLQRKGIPFAAGILSPNDADYSVAKKLATQMIETPAFEPVSEETIKDAIKMVDFCELVICAEMYQGSGNQAVNAVVKYAIEKEKIGENVVEKPSNLTNN